MGFLANLFHRAPAELITCIVGRDKNGTWESVWVDANLPEAREVSLDQMCIQTSVSVANLYQQAGSEASGELQYAIYPWKMGDTIDVILQITRTGATYTAKDIQGSALEIKATSLDELVRVAEPKLTDPAAAMFQWIRQSTDLTM